ncbi:unnamed protein product (macronuclear) [Paramecium tetraurelia]|uniref:Uncharacterized protein n=1 Tax=Paramecium tetraurelia TaxID=5888 RepID=A0C5W1_PARTE|nr:uncharacterized protein GSPATT00035307001 [Paramecium tetraurelia]CAK66178.1 unnamed protein product [Paramecium tetraurelia]|eukprot:XP_001433575.1 hypothetical protein (macronuclear) [Paramecium tetraurelia strain d4-2]
MQVHTDKSPAIRTTKSRVTVSPNSIKSIPITHKVINRIMVPIYLREQQQQQQQQPQNPDVIRLQQELEMWIQRYRELEQLYQGHKNHLVIITQYQERIDMLVQENHQMSLILEARIQEVQQWERSYYELQQQLQYTQTNRESEFQIQINQYSNVIASYEKNINELKSTLQLNQQEALQWRERCDYLQKEQENLRQYYENQRQQDAEILIQSADQQRQQNESEVYKLRNQLDMRMKELEQFKQQNHQLEQTLIEVGSSQQNYETKLLLLTQEIENSNDVFQKKAQQFEITKKRNQELEQENQILREQYDQFAQQLDFYRQKYEQEVLNQRKQESSKLDRERTLSEEMKRIQLQIEERDRRIKQLEVQIQANSQYQSQLIQLEDQCQLFQQEIERLNGQVRQKEQQIQQMQLHNEQTQQKHYKNENTLIKIQNEYQQLIIQQTTYQNNIEQMQRVKMQLEERIILLGSEIERLNDIQRQLMNELDQNVRTRRNENETINTERQKYSIIIEQQSRELSEYKLKLNQIELIRSQSDQLKSDNDRLNQLLRHLQNENEQWRQNYNKLEEQLQQDYETKIIMLSQEIERLSILINERSTEMETNRRKVTILEEELSKKRYSQEEKLAMLTSEIERLNLLNLSYSEQIEMLKTKLIKQDSSDLLLLREKNLYLNQEIERLQNLVEDLNKELEIYRLKYADQFGVGSKYEELLLYLSLYKVEIESLRAQLTDKEKEVNDMRRSQLAPYRR